MPDRHVKIIIDTNLWISFLIRTECLACHPQNSDRWHGEHCHD